MDDMGQVDESETGKTDILRLKLLSLSLTEAHGDPKTYEKNVHETMAGFPKLRDERLTDFASVFKLVDVKDNARARRHKVLAFFRENMTRENLHQAGEVHESSHHCLVLIDEFRELMDRLISWLSMCLPANDHPLSVSHQRKLKLFQKRLAQEAKRLEQRRSTVSLAHSIRVSTIRSMFRAKDVADADVPAWETAHQHLLTMQETETYLSMCRVWLNTLDSALLIFNYWKVNLKDNNIAFGSGETSSGKRDSFYA